ncbi:hypothetical protein Ocin01_13507 [Orchesella cincta]|uniref:Uncharacterized protein n=1 Tax=Orchesella cincta TaxID=48709 RepID=A0A1D2MJW4_ORCCI|nr:hypothetical protein Ocin01_13507 [Orchesella cincta]
MISKKCYALNFYTRHGGKLLGSSPNRSQSSLKCVILMMMMMIFLLEPSATLSSIPFEVSVNPKISE